MTDTLNILYLVHDVTDPAVRRRMMMLREGGAQVTLAGFRRTATPAAAIEGVIPVDLGRTHDGRFLQRLTAVGTAALSLGTTLRRVRRPDLILARNLEMLALATRARSLFRGDGVPIVYECLDIHRLLLRDDMVGRAMRGAERRLLDRASLLLTSSPAFIRDYFAERGQGSVPFELLENRHFEPVTGADDLPASMRLAPPWRIGWHGALRCSRSLQLMSAFSRRAQGRFEVVLRGRPALSEFADFHASVEAEPFLSFEGGYRNPEDIEAIYRDVHFSWAIDFFEDDLNSKWLLPNRLYEGCRFGAVPIAMDGTETARFLRSRDIGIVLPAPTAEALETAFADMNMERFQVMQANVTRTDRATWVCDRRACEALVKRLAGLTAAPHVTFSERLA